MRTITAFIVVIPPVFSGIAYAQIAAIGGWVCHGWWSRFLFCCLYLAALVVLDRSRTAKRSARLFSLGLVKIVAVVRVLTACSWGSLLATIPYELPVVYAISLHCLVVYLGLLAMIAFSRAILGKRLLIDALGDHEWFNADSDKYGWPLLQHVVDEDHWDPSSVRFYAASELADLGEESWLSWVDKYDSRNSENLGNSGEPRAVKPLLRALRTSRTDSQGVAEALGNLGNVRAVKPLIRVLRDRKRKNAWREVAEALAQLGDVRAVGPLISWAAPLQGLRLS